MKNFNEMKKVEKFNAIMAVLENAEMREVLNLKNEEMVEFLKSEIELINKRNAYKSTKPSAKQVANESIKTQIREILACSDKPLQCKTIGEMCGGLSASKVSALLHQMDGINKTEVKRVSYFSLIQ